MKFTNGEMHFLNTLSDNKGMPGVFLEPVKADKEFIDSTVESLQKKGIIDEEGQITELGLAPIQAMKFYKNAKEHLVLNDMSLARVDNGFITISRTDKEHDIVIIDSFVLVLLFLDNFQYLRGGKGFLEQDEIKVEKYSDHEFIKNSDYWEEYLMFEKYEEGRKVSNWLYYAYHGKGYVYHKDTQISEQLDPRQMGIRLLEECGVADWNLKKEER